MGEDGERVPVEGDRMSEGPFNADQAKSAADGRIFIDVRVVVVIDELEMEGLAKDDPDQEREAEADGDDKPPILHSRVIRCGTATGNVFRRANFHPGALDWRRTPVKRGKWMVSTTDKRMDTD